MSDRPTAPRLPAHPSTRPPQARAVRFALAPIVLSWLMGAQLSFAPPAVAQEPAAPAPAAAAAPEIAGVQPGIQYEDTLAHAHDRIAFEPGGRVTVGFRPRAGDGWEINGRAPRALPAGSASGRELLGNPRVTTPGAVDVGPAATPDPSPAPVASPSPNAVYDEPSTDPSATPDADGASAMLPATDDPLALDGTRLRRQVFGFLPYWEVNDAVLDYEVLSTVAYFSVGSDKDGNLLKTNSDGSTTTGWGGWTSSRMTSIINAAHQKGTRVVLTISMFAWTSGQAAAQGALLGSATARLNLAKQAAAAVRARGADGINLDFEPIASGYDDEFTAFVKTVRSELNKQAAGYQLTFDTTGYIGNYPIEAATATDGADAVFIMGYDYRTASSSSAGSIDPLAGPAYDLADTVNAFSARIAPAKIILGLPWYGRAWSTVSDAVNARSQSGTQYGASAAVIYSTAVDYAAQYGRRWDSRELTSWVAYPRENCTTTYGCVTSWRQIYYDDPTAMKLRFDLINRKGLRGAGIWALGYDGSRPELRQAIAEKFLNDRTAPLAGVRTLPATQASEQVSVSWAGTDESGIRDYDLQVSIDGGPWNDWLFRTTATSAVYTGADGHGFAFRARARDNHANVSAWDVSSVYTAHPALAPGGFGRVVASTLNVRSAASTSASIVTTVSAGTILAITGGPVSAEGYAWFKATLPIREWAPVDGVTTDVWVAASDASSTNVVAAAPPNTTVVNLPSGTAPAPGARFVGLTPVRLLDTRVGNGLSGAFTSGAARTFPIAGRGGVPLGAVAVSLTAVVTRQTAAGYLSLGPSTATVGRSSTLNVPKGDTRAIGVMAGLASNGTLAALWMGSGGSTAHVVIDVTGYFVSGSSGAAYVPVAPARILDSRTNLGTSGGAFLSDTPRAFDVAGHGGIPSGALAVTGNLVAVAPPSSGHAYLGPTASATPTSSTINVPKGDIRAASVTVKLDGAGRLALVWKGVAGSKAHFIFDVTGYFVNSGAGATYYPIDPARVVDSRIPNGLSAALPSNLVRRFQATGRGTVPIDAAAITGNLTIVGPTAAGWLSVGPTATAVETISLLNAPRADIRANGVAVPVGSFGGMLAEFHAANGTSTHVILDLSGYFR